MHLFDAHCHLDLAAFDADRDEVLQRARAVGVQEMLLPGVSAASWPRLLQLSDRDPLLFPCLGLHPLFIHEHQPQHLQQLQDLLQQRTDVVAVGEIGVDFWSPALQAQATVQWQLLDAQLALAHQFDLPVVLHVRKGMDLLIQRLKKARLPRGGLVHAFSGSLQQAEQLVDLGFCIGLGGALTYPRAQRLRQVAGKLPLTALLLETDSPDMPLAGFQGQRNEPSRIPLVLNCLAEIRQMEPATLAEILYENLQRVFPRISC
ncbi:TatD family hydrolase [Marinospirillum alkaliphilum]|uniref:TatD DNase family protein n=1 Tax=Marinospirillum alkaliphilum DSM 21637 TaxID=1122209 RepID=A0A1K1TVS0_9GAMM|nr:TatD family hydrolase [Marinospirillum alkaliphilum]SFX04624.1 TatD DNase family protein [Marinospirillum alkaliphilum DSM 21637]